MGDGAGDIQEPGENVQGPKGKGGKSGQDVKETGQLRLVSLFDNLFKPSKTPLTLVIYPNCRQLTSRLGHQIAPGDQSKQDDWTGSGAMRVTQN